MIELVLTMTLLGIIAAVGSVTMMPALNSWILGSVRTSTTNTATYAMDRLLSEIGGLKDKKSVVAASATSFQFVDAGNNNITFNLANGNLMRNNNILARGVSGLTFTYWDVNQATVANPTVSPADTNIWRIGVQLTSQVSNQTIRMESEIHPRNLART